LFTFVWCLFPSTTTTHIYTLSLHDALPIYQEHAHTRRAMDLLIERGWDAVSKGRPLEIVTGNNDADAVWFMRWAERNFEPAAVEIGRAHVVAWGGNSSGLGVANIDPQGKVHPDP